MCLLPRIYQLFMGFMIVSSDVFSGSGSDNSSNESGCSESSGNSSIESSDGIPSHRFNPERKNQKQKGKAPKKRSYIVTLEIGPYLFKRRIDAKVGNVALFSCNLCSEVDCGTYASARKISEKRGKPTYQLIRWPKSDDHLCVPSTTRLLAKKLLRDAKALITLTKGCMSVGQCYKDAKAKLTETMTPDELLNFNNEISNLYNCNSSLYKFRNKFIPNDPATAKDFDTTSDWFNTDDTKESIVMADIAVGGKRSVIFTTNRLLEIMARAPGLGVDGTFRSCPKQWYQLLVISGEVFPGHWEPLIYIYCPDKIESTYENIFGAIKSRLKDLGLSLNADYWQCDFELAIRSALEKTWKDITVKGCHFHYGKIYNIFPFSIFTRSSMLKYLLQV